MPEEGKRLPFYIDIEHLQSEVGIVEQRQFWADWDSWGVQGQLGVRLIEDTSVSPIKLPMAREDTLIVRKFGDVEPGNYWYHVCEGEALLPPLRRAIRWAPSLVRIVVRSSLGCNQTSTRCMLVAMVRTSDGGSRRVSVEEGGRCMLWPAQGRR